MSRVSVEATSLLPCDVVTAWSLLADTNALNRAAGLDRMRLTPTAGSSAARMIGTTRYGGLPATFEELPFVWEAPRAWSVERRMTGGLTQRVETFYALHPTEDDQARFVVHIDVDVVSALLNPFARAQTQRSADALARAAVDLVTARASKASVTLPAPVTSALVRLRPRVDDPALADRLAGWVVGADELAVARIRPHALADEWGVPRRALLATCLAATQAGLLELSWELVCPGCRNGTTALPSLATIVEDEGNCNACELRFRLDAEGAIEALFRPQASIRKVDATPFCSGGPLRMPHIVTQGVVAAGRTARLLAPLDVGHLRATLRGHPAVEVDVVPGAPDEVTAAPGHGPVRVCPGGVVLVPNPTSEERHARLERTDAPRDAATVRDVITLPGFREAFSGDTLRPGFALTIGRVALFFSDLADSTQLYEQVGDAAAFRLVQDHFALVEGILRRHGGTVVKTIGDAVMAAFSDDTAAVAAAVEVLAAFEQFRAEEPLRARTHIKLGVHAGACYAVTANGTLDYFGQAVNIAARLQGLAAPGELVVDAELAGHAGDAARLGSVERATLKGVAHPVDVVRLRWTRPDRPSGG